MGLISGIYNKISRKNEILELTETFEKKLTDISSYYEDRIDTLYEHFDYASKDTDSSTQTAEELKYVTPASREDLLAQCMFMYYKNPWARNIIDITTNFICGTGFNYRTQDTNEKIQEYIDSFWNDPENRLITRLSEIVTRVLRDGEIFIRYFRYKNGRVIVRFIDPGEISEIFTDKNDREHVTNYHYYVQTYVDDQNNTINAIDTRISAEDMQHIKINVDSDVKRGRSILEPALKYLKYYEDWMFGRIVINRMKSSIFLEEIIHGGSPSDVATLKNAQTQRTNITSRTAYKLPRYGTKVIHGDNIEYKWADPNIKADDTKEDGRQIKLSIAAAVGAPEHIVTSDASNNNYASLAASQIPYIRKIQAFQDRFSYELREMFRRVICHGIDIGKIPENSKENKLNEKSMKEIRRLNAALEVIREHKDNEGILEAERKIYEIEKDPYNYEEIPCATKTSVYIEWAPVIVDQELPLTKSLELQIGLGLVSKETAAARLGYNYRKELRKMEENKGNNSDVDTNNNRFKPRKSAKVGDEK